MNRDSTETNKNVLNNTNSSLKKFGIFSKNKNNEFSMTFQMIFKEIDVN